jgi:hypothetical protein
MCGFVGLNDISMIIKDNVRVWIGTCMRVGVVCWRAATAVLAVRGFEESAIIHVIGSLFLYII